MESKSISEVQYPWIPVPEGKPILHIHCGDVAGSLSHFAMHWLHHLNCNLNGLNAFNFHCGNERGLFKVDHIAELLRNWQFVAFEDLEKLYLVVRGHSAKEKILICGLIGFDLVLFVLVDLFRYNEAFQ